MLCDYDTIRPPPDHVRHIHRSPTSTASPRPPRPHVHRIPTSTTSPRPPHPPCPCVCHIHRVHHIRRIHRIPMSATSLVSATSAASTTSTTFPSTLAKACCQLRHHFHRGMGPRSEIGRA